MIALKTREEIKIMREGGKILASVLKKLAQTAKEGVSLKELDQLAESLIREAGAKPAFLGYKPHGASKGFPASICASVNEVVVHGLPNKRKLEEGDIVKIDLGVLHKGFYTDTAITVAIGEISDEAKKLMRITREALDLAIKECKIGKTLGDVGWLINNHAVISGFKPSNGLTGHGIGRQLHEEPTVYNKGQKGRGLKLEEGMVIAIEPMLSAGSAEIVQLPDESYATKDGSLSAHFEHTIAITKQGPQVLTR